MEIEMSTAGDVLAKPANTAMTCAGEETGLEELRQDDMVVPVCYIVNDKSKVQDRDPAPEELGMIYNPVTDCLASSIIVIPLVFTKTRVMMPEKYNEGNMPLCGSLDFENPSEVFGNPKDGIKTMQEGPCAACHFSKWNRDRNGLPLPSGQTAAPACNEVWNFLFLGDDLFPFWMRFKSTALPNAKKYVSALLMAMRIQKGKMWHFQCEMRVTTVRTAKGKVFVPMFSGIKAVDDEQKCDLDETRAILSSARPPHKRAEEKEEDFPF